MYYNEMKTPRGLKVKLFKEICYSFELKEGVFIPDILIKIEKLMSTPRLVLFLAGLFMFFSKISPVTILFISFSCSFFFRLAGYIKPVFYITKAISYIVPEFWVDISGWFIDRIILLLLGLFTVGWFGTAMFFAGLVANSVIYIFINLFIGATVRKKYGFFIWNVERMFIWLLIRGMTEKVTYRKWIDVYSRILCETKEEAQI
ncbi:MAG TPA: hypothetical protein PKX46_06210 [Clostridia bacterium]|nr:hypothetical protein [Clostridia bacterium]